MVQTAISNSIKWLSLNSVISILRSIKRFPIAASLGGSVDIPNSSKVTAHQPRGWIRRIVLILALGPLPVAVLAISNHFIPGLIFLNDDQSAVSICGGLAALWGLSAGVLRRSLLRAIIGLNVGALMGGAFGSCTISFRSTFMLVSCLAASGALLGVALNLRRRDLLKSLLKGAYSGALAFGFIGFAAWGVTELFDSNLLGWTVMSLVPFGLGLWIFFRLAGRDEDAPIQRKEPEEGG